MNGAWVVAGDGDPLLRKMYERHYSCKRPGGAKNTQFVGPGEKLVLRTTAYDAMFAWQRQKLRKDDQHGVCCSIFRNEGPLRSSALIREACVFAWAKWPGERLFTFVDGRRIRSTNPGFCFLAAGWRRAGRTKDRRLHILELIAASRGTAADC